MGRRRGRGLRQSGTHPWQDVLGARELGCLGTLSPPVTNHGINSHCPGFLCMGTGFASGGGKKAPGREGLTLRGSLGGKVRAPLVSTAPWDPKHSEQSPAPWRWVCPICRIGFTGEETEVQRGKVTCFMSHSKSLGNWHSSSGVGGGPASC